MRQQDDVESPLPALPANKKVVETRWYRRKVVFIGVAVMAFFLFLTLGLTLRKSNDDSWQSMNPSLQYIETTLFVQLTRNRLVVAGMREKDAMVEIFAMNDGGWNRAGSFTLENVATIESMAVDVEGTRVVLAVGKDASTEFHVYKEINHGEWEQHGDAIDSSELTAADIYYSNVMLSADGRTLAISYNSDTPSNDGNNEDTPADGRFASSGAVQVFTDSSSLGTVGGVWTPRGAALENLHDEHHGRFATFTAMDGECTKLVIAGEFDMISVYELYGDHWNLTAEFDEGAHSDLGSLSMSTDGSTWAAGSYSGVGEVRVQNEFWPWFTYSEDSQASVQVSLSADGHRLAVGRFPIGGGTATLQVYHFHGNYENEWVALEEPFANLSYDGIVPGSVDISDDGNRVAAVVNGKPEVYQYVGTEDTEYSGSHD